MSRSFFVLFVIIAIILVIIAIILIRRSSTSQEQLDCQELAPPTNIVAVPQGFTTIDVSFTRNQTATAYRVYIGVVPNFNRNNALNSILTNQTQINIENLIAGRTYYIRVSSINNCLVEGTLSDQIPVNLAFPRFFQIQLRSNPSLVVSYPSLNSQGVLNPDCGTSGGCKFEFDEETKFIHPPGNDLLCLVSTGSNGGAIEWEECEDADPIRRQWRYDGELGSFCHEEPSALFDCLTVNQILPGEPIVVQPYADVNERKWNLSETTLP